MRLTADLSVASVCRLRPAGPALSLDFATGTYRANGKPKSLAQVLSFARAGTAWRVTSGGVLAAVTANLPRFDHTGTGMPLGLLIEPAATNIVDQSSNFADAAWFKARLSGVSGAAAPDATLTATTLTRTSSTEICYASNASGAPAGATYTASVYAKAGPSNALLGLRIQGSYPRMGNATFNLVAGTIVATAGTASNTGTTATISPLADGWYRCSLTTSFVVAENTVISMVLGPATSGAPVNQWEVSGPISDVTVWGAQLEEGSVVTSHVPTGAAAEVRAADAPEILGLTGMFNVTLTYDDLSEEALSAVSITPGWWPTLQRPWLRSIRIV